MKKSYYCFNEEKAPLYLEDLSKDVYFAAREAFENKYYNDDNFCEFSGRLYE